MLYSTFKGPLPLTTKEIREVLSGYATALLLGEKIDAFTYTGEQSVPPQLRLLQISPATSQLGFDWPVDVAVVGDVRTSLEAIARELGVESDFAISDADVQPDLEAFRLQYPDTGPHASDALGWAMLVAVGISVAGKGPAICFVGDGGSMFSLHSIWSAAALEIPVVFVCFVNNEYRLLKDLWVNFLGGDFDNTKFVGLDFNNPPLDLDAMADGDLHPSGSMTLHPRLPDLHPRCRLGSRTMDRLARLGGGETLPL